MPGYGMAVAQAQHALKELVERLEDKGVEVKFAIHPMSQGKRSAGEEPAIAAPRAA